MEANEKALLQIIAEHIQVTERLLDHYVKLANAVRLQPEIRERLPAIQQPPTLRELHASTQKLLERVRAIVQQK